MPLIKSSSKKAFVSNLKKEEGAGKPPKQSLAIAYSVQRMNKKKKKMANGGSVDPTQQHLMQGDAMSDSIERGVVNQTKKRLGMNGGGMTEDSRAAPGISESERGEHDLDQLKDRQRRQMEDGYDPALDHTMAPGEGESEKGLYENRQESERKRRQGASTPPTSSWTEDTESGEYEDHQMDDEKRRQAEHEDPSESDRMYQGDRRATSIADAILNKKKYADGGMVDLEEDSEEEPNQYDDRNEFAAGKEQYDDTQLEPQPMDSNEHGDDIDSDEHDMIPIIIRKMKSNRRGY